jgi:putative ABC transport system ATP-binding protein
MSNHAPMLQMKGVMCRFDSPQGLVRVLEGLDLEVSDGEFLMVTGPSGSGKTTLLNLAALLERPSGGDITFLGRTVSHLCEDELCDIRKTEIGMIFQKFSLLPFRSAFENVMMRFRYVQNGGANVRRLAERALEDVGLISVKDRSARLLSAGEMQRVAIARAVALRPRLLVADEPTGNLDRCTAMSVMDCLGKFHQQGITILMVTHNEELLRYGSRHLVCRDGRLEADPARSADASRSAAKANP